MMIVPPRDRVLVAARPHDAFRVFLRDYVDPPWYLSENPDVAETRLDASEHYAKYGRAERRFPNQASQRCGVLSHLVDTDWYLSRYADVAVAGMDPLVHYETFGRDEERSANALVEKRGGFAEVFDGIWYLDRYKDVAHANIDPRFHYVRYGCVEGRYPNRRAEERSMSSSSELYEILRLEKRFGNKGVRDYFEFKTCLTIYRLGFEPFDIMTALDYYDACINVL